MDATRRLPRSAPRHGSGRAGRSAMAAAALLAAAAILLVAVGPASSATVDRSWRASLGARGANGTVTVIAMTTGTGSVTLRLAGLPHGAPVAATIRVGTCAKPGAAAAAVSAGRTSSSGKVTRTLAIGRTAVSRMTAASTLVAQVGSAGFARCAALRRDVSPSGSPGPSTSPPPSTAPSPSAGTGIEVHAQGFAFSPGTVTVAAGKPVVASFRNDDGGVAHGMNVGIGRSAAPLATSGVITGVASATFRIPALAAGTYLIWCPIHASMSATLVVAGVADATPSPAASPTTAAATASASPSAPPTPAPTEQIEPPPSYYPY